MKLPVIDVNRLDGTDWYPELDTACRQWGCFQIINHGVSMPVLTTALEAMQKLFALPRSEKLKIERTSENAWGFYDQELTKNVRDWKEIFDFGPVATSGPMLGSTPQWPADIPGFKSAVEAFYLAAEGVSAKLLKGISKNLGMAPDDLSGAFRGEHSSFLRLNFYPPCDAPEEHLGISPHTDSGALTVLLHDGVPGLQFFQDGSWHTVEPIPGALIINIGDIVQVWSNDRYTAPPHRVLANSSSERYSAPFFYNPSYDTDYAPLPHTVSETNPARYRAINWGEFRAARAAGDYANFGEEIQITKFHVEPN